MFLTNKFFFFTHIQKPKNEQQLQQQQQQTCLLASLSLLSLGTFYNLHYAMSVDPISRRQMHSIFLLCRRDQWRRILQLLEAKPELALSTMIMDNHIATTIMHQAITSKAQVTVRARVIAMILERTPEAASIRNGYGSLPLHVITQRNTKMDSQTKERLILLLIHANPKALVEEGGVGRRTPLHIAFTDYISPKLARTIIHFGKAATRLKDRKGWLPIHVACSRHCSPEKLRMLLEAYPQSLHERTSNGQSLLELAKQTATKTHPNYALIAELEQQLLNSSMDDGRNDEVVELFTRDPRPPEAPKMLQTVPFRSTRKRTRQPGKASDEVVELCTLAPKMPEPPKMLQTVPFRSTRRRSRQPTQKQRSAEAANLLLHFSRESAQMVEEQSARAVCHDEAPMFTPSVPMYSPVYSSRHIVPAAYDWRSSAYHPVPDPVFSYPYTNVLIGEHYRMQHDTIEQVARV